jgi:hypothetical protein
VVDATHEGAEGFHLGRLTQLRLRVAELLPPSHHFLTEHLESDQDRVELVAPLGLGPGCGQIARRHLDDEIENFIDSTPFLIVHARTRPATPARASSTKTGAWGSSPC